MGESTIQLISDGGMVVFAAVVFVTGAIALHRRWVVVGWQYAELREDYDELKASEKESNEVKREMIAAVTVLTDEVRELRREVHQ